MGEKRDHLRRYQLHRYHARPFRNPYFSRDPGPRRRNWRLYAYAVLGVGLVLGAVYLIGFLPLWMIQDIRIEGLQFMAPTELMEMSEARLQRRRYLIFPQSNRFFFDAAALQEDIARKFSFETLSVEIKEGTLTITAKERVSEIMWQTGESVFYVSMDGTVIRELSQEERETFIFRGSSQPLTEDGTPLQGPYPLLIYLNSLALVMDASGEGVEPGGRVLEKASVPSIIDFNKQIQEKAGLRVLTSVVEKKDSPWVRARVSEGFDILYDTNESIAEQVENVRIILMTAGVDPGALIYIDIRFGDHVYFK